MLLHTMKERKSIMDDKFKIDCIVDETEISLSDEVLKIGDFYIYFGEHRADYDVKMNIVEFYTQMQDIKILKHVCMMLCCNIKNNLLELNSRFKYNGNYIEISRHSVQIFNMKITDEVCTKCSDKKACYEYLGDNYDWAGVLLEILTRLNVYLIDMRYLVNCDISVAGKIIKVKDVVKIGEKVRKIEDLKAIPEKKWCAVKYYFDSAYYIVYDLELLSYTKDITQEEEENYMKVFRAVQ